MRKTKLLLAACAMLGVMTANADVMLETDLTSSFNSLATTQWTGSSGQVGWAAPQVTTNSGLKVAAWERYDGNCNSTGELMTTNVTGLVAGTYKIELYGAAAFTFGRGFGSTAFTEGSEDHNDSYKENDKIDAPGTGVVLFASTSEGDYELEIPIWYATNFNTSGLSTVVLEGVVVGDDGNIKIGMSKTSTSTNWHVVQLKGVTATVSGDAAIAALKATATSLLADANYENVTGTERTNLEAAKAATPAEETEEAYKEVIDDLNTAINAFENAKIAYDAYNEALTAAQAVDQTALMNADVLSALQTVIAAQGTMPSTTAEAVAATNDLNTAVTNANASVTAYASAKAYFDEAETILAGTNVYTATAYATYYTEPKAKYEAKTLTTEEANDLKKLGGWHVPNTLDDILLSAWTIGGEQAKDYDKSLYINTWSTEGNSDGSEFLTPFFEYWTSDGNSLGANSLVATITGLKPSTTYSFTIRARVRQTDGQTKIAEGITMKVGEGTPVDISAGTIFKTGPFFIGNFSAVGETDAEGKLVATISVAENSNISWLSFYNCKYTEGEDLSAYIADYEFALDNANNALGNAAYAAVTGKEKTDLTTAVSTYGTVDNTDKAALIAAKDALETAFNTFVQAATVYNAFAELNANVAAKLGVAMPTITSATVASDLEAIIVNEFEVANAYAIDYTSKLGAWNNAPGTNQGESWDGTTGDGSDTYYDLYNSADRAMYQTITLPAGDYALIAKGRASDNGLLTLTDGTNTITFAHKSSVGRGIATDGTATFDAGATYANYNNGRGWEYRVLTFTSDGTTPITLTFNWKTSGSNWAGLDDITLKCNNTSESVEVTDAGYATYVSDANLDFSATTIKAYIAAASDDKVVLTPIDKVAAGTPVVLYAEGGKTEDIPVFAGAADDATGNELVRGTGAAVASEDGYILNKIGGIVAFYAANNKTVAKNRAYLPKKGGSARMTIVFADEATGISSMLNAQCTMHNEIYNLQGQRVKNAQKGLYIQNGKKFVK